MASTQDMPDGFELLRFHALSPSKCGPAQGNFDRLLAWLHPDRDEAGRKYELIRRKLISVFASRGFEFPDELADETINRVMAKVVQVAENYRGDPALYFYGVARNVGRECRRPKKIAAPPPPVGPADSNSAELDCLDECMEHLLPKNRQMLLEYYQGDGKTKIDRRKELALHFGLDMNALRIRLHRIRSVVAECATSCVERRSGADSTRSSADETF